MKNAALHRRVMRAVFARKLKSGKFSIREACAEMGMSRAYYYALVNGIKSKRSGKFYDLSTEKISAWLKVKEK